MANTSGDQPDVKYCPTCKAPLQNVPRSQMKSKGYVRAAGTVAQDTHTYRCTAPRLRQTIRDQSRPLMRSACHTDVIA